MCSRKILFVFLFFFGLSSIGLSQEATPNNNTTICNFLVSFLDTIYRYESGEHFGGYSLVNRENSKGQTALITGGTDNNINPSAPLLPFGVSRCMRVGDLQAGLKGGLVRIETICLVEQISLFYRMVADKVENHKHGEYPYTKIRIMDQSMKNIYCFDDFLTTLHEGEPGVSVSPTGKLYTAWREIPLNLQQFFGRRIIIEIETGDCAFGEHLAYTYFYFKCRDTYSPQSNVDEFSNFITSPKLINGCPTTSPKIIQAKAGFKSYKWSTGQFTSSIAVTEPGVYKVRVAVDSSNCQGEDSVVYSPDLAYIDLEQRFFCPGYAMTLSIKNFDKNSKDSIVSIEWDLADNGSIDFVGNNYDVNINQKTAVRAIIKTKNGCNFSLRRLITRAELPPVPLNPIRLEQISGTCLGNFTRVTAANYQQVNWDVGNDGSFEVIDKNELIYRFPKVGDNPLRMRVITKPYGCYKDTVFNINITMPAESDIFLAKSGFCMGERIRLTPLFANTPTRVQWDLDGDGYYDPRMRPIGFTPDTVFFFPGQREVGLRAFRSPTCIDTIRKKIEIFSFPFGNIVGEMNLCSYLPVGKYWVETKFDVDFVDWKPINGLIDRREGDTIWVNWFKNRSFHSIQATVTSTQGCSYQYDPKIIKIWPSGVTQTPVGANFICLDKPLAAYSVNEMLGYSYDWQVENGEILNGQGTNLILVKWLKSGKGRIYLAPSQVIDTVCFDKSEVLEVDIAPAKDSIVELLRVSVEDAGGVDMFWRIEGEDTNENVLITRDNRFLGLIPKSSGNYRDQTADLNRSQLYKLTTYNKCADSVSSLSHQNIALSASFNEQAKTIALQWSPYINWPSSHVYELWSSFDGQPFKRVASTDSLTKYFENGNDAFQHCFKIKALADNNLFSWSNTACVRFRHQVKMNEFLTPNGDGLNDRLVVESLSRYPENELFVFNRFGQVVYTKSGYDNSWQGDELQGTYFCVFNYRLPDGTWHKTGSALTILR